MMRLWLLSIWAMFNQIDGLSTFDERMRKLESRMYELDHSLTLQLTRQREDLDVMFESLGSYRPCEFWETDAGSVSTGAIITGITLLLAFLFYKCTMRYRINEEQRLLSRMKHVIRNEIRSGLYLGRVCDDLRPPSYESVTCPV